MADYKSNNPAVKETLAQLQGKMDLFQGNMETIMEYLQAQRAYTSTNPITTIVTNVIVVTTSADVVATVENDVETVVPTAMNQPIFPSTSNRIAVVYPWGMPPNFASQFANEGIIPHQALVAPSTAGNPAFPWGMPVIQSPQTVDPGNPKNIEGQVHTKMLDDDAEY